MIAALRGRRCLIAALLYVVGGLLAPASADLFLLKNGGRVEGNWINRDEENPEKYVVSTGEGAEVELLSANVSRVVESSPAERRYQELLPRMPDSAWGNWQMAEWCLKHRLLEERTGHLEAVIELDPDHADARRALGYTLRNGQWARPDDVMRARGYVQHSGRWYLPQEIELVKSREARQAEDAQWRQQIKRWHGWLGTQRDRDAREQFATLADPAASGAITSLLEHEDRPQVQLLLIKTLGRLGGQAAETALVRVALTSENATHREVARDHILALGGNWAYGQFLAALGSKDVNHLRRAAFALGMLGNREAVVPLIDVLVTRHKIVTTEGGPGQLSPVFGTGPSGGGTGFSAGGTTRVHNKDVAHAEVLNALKQLTDVNFGYNQAQWRAWYFQANSPPSLNLRRED